LDKRRPTAAGPGSFREIAGAAHFFLQRQELGSKGVLTDVFNKSADVTLAYYFINYGTPKLKKLGQEWANAPGYRTIAIPTFK
jgi:hypothetical protein